MAYSYALRTKKNFRLFGVTFLGVLIGALIGVSANADTHDDRWYLSPMLGYVIADSDRLSDDGAWLGLAVGKPLSPRFNLELEASADKLDLESGADEYSQWGVGVNALYFFSREGAAPYLLGGVGALNTELGTEDNTNAALNLGVGFMPVLTRTGMALRAEARYRLDADDKTLPAEDRFDDFIIGLGLTIPLGSRASEPAPTPVAAVEPAAPADSDGDGIIDERDACPNSPAGARVDSRGCELDSDGDGVVDSRDRCPGTARGAKVDAAGCLVAQTIVLKGVIFRTNSAELAGDSVRILDEAARTLRDNPGLKVEVAGHTDDRGAAAYNASLSQRRAESVRSYLIGQGVAANRLSAKGYGEAEPIDTNQTAAGRANNRRVELRIVK